MRPVAGVFILFGALIPICVIVAGVIYERAAEKKDREGIPQIGQSIDIGGRSLNIYCSGQGSPAVILEAANGPGLFWSDIQAEIAKFTTACWYDRAGEGWSDPAPSRRTAAALARDLHEVLARVQIPGPYVFAGWSFGGLIVRVYSGLYPGDVAGVVLIDSAHEDEPKCAPKFFLASSVPQSLVLPISLVVQAAFRTGLIRLTQSSPRLSLNLKRHQLIYELKKQPKAIAADALTGIAIPQSYEQARSISFIGDPPLIVLTAGEPLPWGDPEMARQAALYQEIWINEIQSKLVGLSRRGRQVIVTKSDHGIPVQAPDAVVAAIQEVVADVRHK